MKLAVCIPVILVVLLLSGCVNQNQQLKCFDEEMHQPALLPLYNQLRQGLTDTLNNWVYVQKYERVQILTRVLWQVDDAVFLSPEHDKAILLLLERDTGLYTSEPTGIRGQKERQVPTFLDDVQLMYASKEKGSWHYYYQSMDDLVVPRSEEDRKNFRPATFKALSLTGQRYLLNSYYNWRSCTYNPEFFDAWDIDMLKYQHTKINGYY